MDAAELCHEMGREFRALEGREDRFGPAAQARLNAMLDLAVMSGWVQRLDRQFPGDQGAWQIVSGRPRLGGTPLQLTPGDISFGEALHAFCYLSGYSRGRRMNAAVCFAMDANQMARAMHEQVDEWRVDAKRASFRSVVGEGGGGEPRGALQLVKPGDQA